MEKISLQKSIYYLVICFLRLLSLFLLRVYQKQSVLSCISMRNPSLRTTGNTEVNLQS